MHTSAPTIRPQGGSPAPQFCDWGRAGRSTVYQTEYWAAVSCKCGADAGNSDWRQSLASSSRCWLRVAVGGGGGRIDLGAVVHPPDLGFGELGTLAGPVLGFRAA